MTTHFPDVVQNNLYFKILNVEGNVDTRSSRGRDRMVVGFTTTYAMSAYHHLRCEFESRGRGALDTTLCDNVCQ